MHGDSLGFLLALTLSDRLNDPDRLAALRRTALSDATADAAFDRLTRLATRVLGVPVALVSLVNVDRQVFKGAVGLGEPRMSRRETPLSHSFCQHVVASSKPFIVEDARDHALVRDNLAIPDLGIVAYAGIPLITAEGHVLGSFCAIDREPRKWSDEDIANLQDLAAAATIEIELLTSVYLAHLARREQEVLFEAAVEGIFGMDAEGRCTFINPAGSRLIGYTTEECLGRNMHGLTHAKRPDGTPYPIQECPIFQAFSAGRSVRLIEETLWRKDGTALPALCSIAPFRNEGGTVAGAVVTVVDVTEQRAAEAALAEREEQLRLAVEAANLGTWSLDVATGEMIGSAGCKQNLGLLPDAHLTYQSLLSMIHPDDRAGMEAAMIRSFEGNGGYETEYRVIWPDGSVHWIAASGGVVYNDARRPVRMAGVTVEVTERRQAEEAQRTFVEAAAHDLRNPLTAIRGQAQLLRRKARNGTVPDPERLAEDLEGIEAAAGRIAALLEELQDAAELRAGQPLELHTEPIDLVALVRTAAAEAQAATGHHRVRVDALREKLVAPLDPARMRRVLDNLLGNAVKYSPRGGRITITVRPEKDAQGAWAVLAVRDEGVGIPAADLPHIFERHRRGANVTERMRGSGVGLTGAQQIVSQHGGKITVESDEGQGSTFVVALPIQPGSY